MSKKQSNPIPKKVGAIKPPPPPAPSFKMDKIQKCIINYCKKPPKYSCQGCALMRLVMDLLKPE